MNETLQQQLYYLFGTPMMTHTHAKSLYAMPDGSVTEDRQKAREAWEWHNLQKNVKKCHVAGKNKFCAGRL